MVLTGYGKEQLSRGQLEFVYWVPFDDEVDYDPYIANSASLSAAELSSSIVGAIEGSLVREATTGYKQLDPNGRDTTNVFHPLFDIPQGQQILPRAIISAGGNDSVTIEVKQRKVSEVIAKRDQRENVIEQLGPFDRGVERFDSEKIGIDLGYRVGDFPSEHKYEGFKITVLQSGSTGLREVDGRRDMNNELAFNNDLKYTGEN